MKLYMTFVYVGIGLGIANFTFQILYGTYDFGIATERTIFQWTALATAYIFVK